jgi:hypothetical protein
MLIVECCYCLVHWQKFTGNNHDAQKVNLGLRNSLNLTYTHLQFKKFSMGHTPEPPLKEAAREGEGGKGLGKGGKGKAQNGRGGEGG